MIVKNTGLKDCKIIEPKVHSDNRGLFFESFQLKRYSDLAGVKLSFVQDNYSYSKRGVLRGLHFQRTKPQGKLVSVVRGSVYDVVVDIRKGSPTFGMWEGFFLDEKKKTQVWVPPGFAHGFLALSKIAYFHYKCTDYYDPGDESTIIWNDPDLNIEWPLDNPILSNKDSSALRFVSFKK